MDKKTIQKIFARFKKNHPYPTTELSYHSPFELLIAVMLSAQATDVSVNQATQKLFPIAATPEQILALGEEKLKHSIKTIGLYHSKTKHILKTCEILIEQHHSQVPKTREALEALPGVGRKTANVILNTLFAEPVIAVDTHLFRITQRIGLANGKTVLEIEKKLYQVIPEEYLRNAHHWLILHGRYICKARKQLCNACLIKDLCEYKNKALV